MARNEEKQLGRLNRLLLKQDKEEQEKKNPRRPRLDDLNSSEAIKKWIPSIKRDIDFCLKQSQVPCYPDSKILECNNKIDYLRRQYWAFVRKLRQLDPSTGSVPWTDRHYTPKKRSPGHTDEEIQKKQQCIDTSNPGVTSSVSASSTVTDPISHGSVTSPDGVISPDQTIPDVVDSNFRPISTPILDGDSSYQTLYGYEPAPCVVADDTVNSNLKDQPLTFLTVNSDLKDQPLTFLTMNSDLKDQRLTFLAKDTSVGSDYVNGATVSVDDISSSHDQTSRHLNDHHSLDVPLDSGDSVIVHWTSNSDFIGNTASEKVMPTPGLIPYSDSSDDND